MKKRILLIIPILLIGGIIVAAFHQGGYIGVDGSVIPPTGDIYPELEKNFTHQFLEEQRKEEVPSSIFSFLEEKSSSIPNIDKITYDIFVSDASLSEIYREYQENLGLKNYEEYPEYSGVTSLANYEIHYYTFVKGFNGVVIGIIEMNGFSWVCYSTGNVFDYLEIQQYFQMKTLIINSPF